MFKHICRMLHKLSTCTYVCIHMAACLKFSNMWFERARTMIAENASLCEHITRRCKHAVVPLQVHVQFHIWVLSSVCLLVIQVPTMAHTFSGLFSVLRSFHFSLVLFIFVWERALLMVLLGRIIILDINKCTVGLVPSHLTNMHSICQLKFSTMISAIRYGEQRHHSW